MDTTKTTYKALLDLIFKDGIWIRTEVRNWKVSAAMYCPKGFNGKQNIPVILMPRATGGLAVDAKSDAVTLDVLMDGSDKLEDELILLAHEFGHHNSSYLDYERVKAAYDADPKSIGAMDRWSLYDEEVLAWGKGRTVLASLGYQDWKLFEQVKTKCLESYRKGLGFSSSWLGKLLCSR